MSVYEIYKTDEKIYDIYTSNYERASILARHLFPNNTSIKIIRKKLSTKCLGCKEVLDADTKCSCWNFS
jgi:hypothetical protein|uniref:Uncharacterized protein n=1 Tax=viral metagenome TaxID=1070528 RepID=A0A6C0J1A9_9ZZZZ